MGNFFGYFVHPQVYNQCGLVIIPLHDEYIHSQEGIIVTKSFAQLGLSTIMIDDVNKSQIVNALSYLYRYAEKLLLVCFEKDILLASNISKSYNALDAIIWIDPILEKHDMQILPKLDIPIFCFYDAMHLKVDVLQEVKDSTPTFHLIPYHRPDLYEPVFYETEQISGHISNPVWKELYKIVEFL